MASWVEGPYQSVATFTDKILNVVALVRLHTSTCLLPALLAAAQCAAGGAPDCPAGAAAPLAAAVGSSMYVCMCTIASVCIT